MTNDEEVFVLYVHDMERLKTFFERLGLQFEEEQHGNGPKHFACAYDGTVLEIYPTKLKEHFRYVSD